jgi:TP901 family phage tail tape measure protein
MSASEEFLRAGHNIQETQQLIEASTVMSKISGQTQADVAQELIAIQNAFNMSAQDMMSVVDKLTTVDNNSATSTAELGQALERTAASAQNAGVTFDELVSWIECSPSF